MSNAVLPSEIPLNTSVEQDTSSLNSSYIDHPDITVPSEDSINRTNELGLANINPSMRCEQDPCIQKKPQTQSMVVYQQDILGIYTLFSFIFICLRY